jgi:putative transposase
VESFNARLRDEPPDGEVSHTVAEARVLVERWRRHYNGARPHSSPGHRPPAPEVLPFAMTRGAAGGEESAASRSH